MTDLVKVSMTFSGVAMLNAIVNPCAVSASGFVASMVLFGFIAFIERKNRIEVERFEQDLKQLNDKISGIAVGMGWKI